MNVDECRGTVEGFVDFLICLLTLRISSPTVSLFRCGSMCTVQKFSFCSGCLAVLMLPLTVVFFLLHCQKKIVLVVTQTF